jgi:hypothetical protein
MFCSTIRQSPASFDGAVDVGLYNTGPFQYDLVGWEVMKFTRRSRVESSGFSQSNRWLAQSMCHVANCLMWMKCDMNEMNVSSKRSTWCLQIHYSLLHCPLLLLCEYAFPVWIKMLWRCPVSAPFPYPRFGAPDRPFTLFQSPRFSFGTLER